MAYNERRWGSDGWTRDLRRSAKADGLAFGGWKYWPSTLQAHRLILLAERTSDELAASAKGVLFRQCYEDSLNISDPKILQAAAKELGLDGALLEGDECRDEVLARDEHAKRTLRISGVPHFAVSRTGPAGAAGQPIGLGGAQPAERFVQAFEQLAS